MAEYRKNNSYISVCNRLIVERILPYLVGKFNAGDFGKNYYVFQDLNSYKTVISKVFTLSIAEEFTTNIKIERGRLKCEPYFLVIKISLPHNEEIGDTIIACVLIDTVRNRAVSYCMEKSTKNYMICEWSEDKHFNYGTTTNFSSFLSVIVTLADDVFNEVAQRNNTQNNSNSQAVSQHHTKNKKPKSKKWDVMIIVSCVVLIGLMVSLFIPKWTLGHTASHKQVNDVSLINPTDEEETLAIESDEDQIEEESEFYNDLAGETYLLYSEDDQKNFYSGQAIPEIPQQQIATKSIDLYENVEITRYRTGEFPFYETYGRGKFDSNSLSELSISNKTTTDAVLLLCTSNGDVIRNVFIKQGSSYTIKNIPSCICIMKVMFGNDWFRDKDNGPGFPTGGFINDVSYIISSWSESFDFMPHNVEEGIDYPTYKITLHAVRNGNFHTKDSSKKEFFNNK